MQLSDIISTLHMQLISNIPTPFACLSNAVPTLHVQLSHAMQTPWMKLSNINLTPFIRMANVSPTLHVQCHPNTSDASVQHHSTQFMHLSNVISTT